MTFDEALNFWYGRINYEVRAATPGDFKLERMTALLHALGDPHRRVRCVHITGTKGKGSTAAMLSSVLRAAGYRVGLFTSPHLSDVRERIQVDDSPIGRDELIARIMEVEAAVRAMEGGELPSPTFFEIGTAIGFLHFCYRRCDIAVIEVGLGGRFDSTNVCQPLVSIISNVGFDHMAQLGNTLEAIAEQKAGIIKRGVPVVCGESQAGPREVIRRVAADVGAPLIAADPASSVAIPLGLLGEHQRANAATAVAAIEQLRAAGLTVSNAAVRTGLREVHWPARIELVAERPMVILDTAHNVPSAEALVKTLRESFPVRGRKSVVLAVSSDKQYPEILRILASFFDRFHLTRYGTNPRSVPPEQLGATLSAIAPGTPFALHGVSLDAWTAARTECTADDLLCITGSVFLAGELGAVIRT